MAALSEWLRLMLGEIASRREATLRAREEDAVRAGEDPVAQAGAPRPEADRGPIGG